MALKVRNPGAIIKALRAWLARIRRPAGTRPLADQLNEIALRCASLPELDTRTADEIIGYDDNGLPR